MKLYHAVSGAAFAAALVVGYGQFAPVQAQTMSCTVSNVMNLKDRCPPGLAFGGTPVSAPVVADTSTGEPTVTPVSYTSSSEGCVKTNVVNLKNACPWN
ncbi:hypothetical protein BH10PSE7_BH10PSE7_43520 [soil metagenome]